MKSVRKFRNNVFTEKKKEGTTTDGAADKKLIKCMWK